MELCHRPSDRMKGNEYIVDALLMKDWLEVEALGWGGRGREGDIRDEAARDWMKNPNVFNWS